MSGSVVQQVARSERHDVGVSVATSSFAHTDSCVGSKQNKNLRGVFIIWQVSGGFK